jgi:hypothetical protein
MGRRKTVVGRSTAETLFRVCHWTHEFELRESKASILHSQEADRVNVHLKGDPILAEMFNMTL